MNRVTPLLLLFSSLLFSFAATACLDPDKDGNLVAPTVDADPTLPRVELNGTVFHAETFGDPNAPVIVVLHGGPGLSYARMLRLRQPIDGARLEDHHLLVFWDQRGAGLSRRHSEAEVTNEAYEADLMAFIDKYSPQRPVVLMGHSWGGMYATMFIAKHPERVAGAVLMDSGPFTGASYEEIKGDMQHLDLFSEWLNDLAWTSAIVSPDDHARADYWRMLGSFGNAEPRYHLPEQPPPTWRIGAVASVALIKNAMTDGKGSWDFTKGLEHFNPPVLFEAGELSEVTGAEFQKKQMKAYPNAHLEVIAGAGHEHQWTHAEATLRPIFPYLSAIGF
jgi:proline iminopeptidase